MVTRSKITYTAAALLIFFSCTDLTEFDHTMRTGISIFYPPDLTIVHTIENISGASSLCPLPDCFIVATTEGTLIRFDLESYEQTGSFIIGSPSAAGYFEIEYSSTESSVYIIAALGQIVEVHVPDMEVTDNFSVCETPVDIEIAFGKPFFYVAGANSSRIWEVRKENNIVSRSCLLTSSPTCMAIDQTLDSILVGTRGTTNLVSTGGGSMHLRNMPHFPKILAIQTIPNDTTLCAVFDYPTSRISTILRYFPDYFYPDKPMWTALEPVNGDIHYMCTESDGSYAYVLSYLGDNISRLVSYDCSSYLIESQIDLQGYPLDLEISPGGTLLVLTTE